MRFVSSTAHRLSHHCPLTSNLRGRRPLLSAGHKTSEPASVNAVDQPTLVMNVTTLVAPSPCFRTPCAT